MFAFEMASPDLRWAEFETYFGTLFARQIPSSDEVVGGAV
jgi:hypothetical protein